MAEETGTHRCVARIKLVEEALVPGIDTALKHSINDLHQTVGANTLFWERQFQLGSNSCGLLVVDKHIVASCAVGLMWNIPSYFFQS